LDVGIHEADVEEPSPIALVGHARVAIFTP
jgi:hypothetical protein